MNSYLIIFLSSAVGLAGATGQIQQVDPPLDSGVKKLRVYTRWTNFLHPRFGYELPIPPGVSAVGNPEAEDRPQFRSADQSFVMSAWGGMAADPPSKVLDDQWNAALAKADRKITYQRRAKTWFVVSGTDVQGIEFYEKLTMNGQHVAFLDITFPRARLRQYERWVEEIEDGFRPVTLREGPPESPPQLSRGGLESKPAPTPESKSTELAPNERPEVATAPVVDRSPSAEKVVGKPGYVYSPFSENRRIVDVVGVPSGTKVKCPYTMKIFRVP